MNTSYKILFIKPEEVSKTSSGLKLKNYVFQLPTHSLAKYNQK